MNILITQVSKRPEVTTLAAWQQDAIFRTTAHDLRVRSLLPGEWTVVGGCTIECIDCLSCHGAEDGCEACEGDGTSLSCDDCGAHWPDVGVCCECRERREMDADAAVAEVRGAA